MGPDIIDILRSDKRRMHHRIDGHDKTRLKQYPSKHPAGRQFKDDFTCIEKGHKAKQYNEGGRDAQRLRHQPTEKTCAGQHFQQGPHEKVFLHNLH